VYLSLNIFVDIFHACIDMLQLVLFVHSARAAWICSSDLPAALALSINSLVKSSAALSSSPA
jgi:hypothetical protein